MKYQAFCKVDLNSKVIIIITYSLEFFTSSLGDGLSLEFV